MNDSANHQIPFLCNISQRSELVSTYYISRLVIFKLFQSHSKLLMPNNVHILISPWLLVDTPIVSHPALASQLVMQWRSCPGTGDQEADGAPWGSTRVIRWVNEACWLHKDPPPSPWRLHKTHELICFKDHDWERWRSWWHCKARNGSVLQNVFRERFWRCLSPGQDFAKNLSWEARRLRSMDKWGWTYANSWYLVAKGSMSSFFSLALNLGLKPGQPVGFSSLSR